MIETSGERGSGKSVLAARHDDDDDISTHIHFHQTFSLLGDKWTSFMQEVYNLFKKFCCSLDLKVTCTNILSQSIIKLTFCKKKHCKHKRWSCSKSGWQLQYSKITSKPNFKPNSKINLKYKQINSNCLTFRQIIRKAFHLQIHSYLCCTVAVPKRTLTLL